MVQEKKAVRRIALPVGHILFFPAFLILAVGTMYSFAPPAVKGLMEKAPFLVELWKGVSDALFAGAQTTADHILRICAVLYLIPFAAFLLVTLAVLIFYHPKAPNPSDNHRQDAETMWTLARHAQIDAWRKERDISGALSIFTGVVAALAVLAMIFSWLLFPGGVNLLTSMSLIENLRFFGLALIVIFSYSLVVLPLAGLMKLVHYCYVPKTLGQAAELYLRSIRKAPVQEAAPAPEAAPVPETLPAEPEVPAEAAEPSMEAAPASEASPS